MSRSTRGSSGARIVVVGGGIAGQSLCERLRERSSDARATRVCVHLSDLLSGDEPSGPLGELQLRPDEWSGDNRIDLLLSTKVERIDLEGHELEFSNGHSLSYDKLALAIV